VILLVIARMAGHRVRRRPTVIHPEMSRALADEQIRELHRRAASRTSYEPQASPVAQHWAVLAMRLHLRRAAAVATTPVGRGAPKTSQPSTTSGGTDAATPAASPAARQPMGCVA
jgi:hypothetical protein